MKVEVVITKTRFFALVVLLLVVGVVAYGTSSPSTFGHSAGEVEVTVGGVPMTLQQAITNGNLSGGSGGSRSTKLFGPNIYTSGGQIATTTFTLPAGDTLFSAYVNGGPGNGGAGTFYFFVDNIERGSYSVSTSQCNDCYVDTNSGHPSFFFRSTINSGAHTLKITSDGDLGILRATFFAESLS